MGPPRSHITSKIHSFEKEGVTIVRCPFHMKK